MNFFKEEIPFFRQIWFFISGICLSVAFQIKPHNGYLYSWIILFAFFITFLVITKKKKYFFLNWIAGILVSILFMLSGIIWCNLHKEIYWQDHFSKTEASHLVVIVQEPPKLKGDIARFPVKVKRTINTDSVYATSGKLLLALRFDTTKQFTIKYGDCLLIKAKYSETEPPYNPAEFNYKRLLSYRQIYHQSFININETKHLSAGKGNLIIQYALKFRQGLVQDFKKYLKDKNSQSVASTLILGDRADLDQEILSAYQNTGTLHVLSVSGMHVMIVVFMLNFAFKRFDRFRTGRVIKLCCMLILIWTYSIVTGLAPSILRAALMVTFLLLSRFSSGRSNSYNVIAIAAFIILLINPLNLMDIGFQLSFLAVLGLIHIYPKIYHLYSPKHKLIDACWQCICVSLAAQITTTPLSLFYFHQFPIYFILGNLFMALPSMIIMIGGFAFLAIRIDFVQYWIGLFLNHFIDFTNNGLLYIEHLPFSTLDKIWLNKLELTLLYLLLLIFLLHKRSGYKILIAGSTILILTLSFAFKNLSSINQHKTLFFSLRKNTAIAYIKGKSCILVTDLDTLEYAYRFSVKPYLDSCGIKNIQFSDPHLYENENIYTFGTKTLKFINHRKNTFSRSKTDWLLISGNRNYRLDSLRKTYHSNRIFIDGKNSDFIVNKLKQQADSLNLDYYILKRSYAKEIDH